MRPYEPLGFGTDSGRPPFGAGGFVPSSRRPVHDGVFRSHMLSDDQAGHTAPSHERVEG